MICCNSSRHKFKKGILNNKISKNEGGTKGKPPPSSYAPEMFKGIAVFRIWGFIHNCGNPVGFGQSWICIGAEPARVGFV